MFDLYLSNDVNKFLRTVKHELRKKGYKEFKSTTNRHIAYMHLNYKTSKFIKGRLIFEFEIDKNENMLSTRYYYFNNNNKLEETKSITLGDVLDMA